MSFFSTQVLQQTAISSVTSPTVWAFAHLTASNYKLLVAM